MRSKKRDTIVEIERFVRNFNGQYGRPPSLQQIGDAVGVSKPTAYRYVKSMTEDGLLNYCGARSAKSAKSSSEMTTAPLVGEIACGLPILAEENVECYIPLPVELFGRGPFFILRAKGDSMVEADIMDGDLVLIRQQDAADSGQIVVALIDDEATLKRYYPEPENHRIRLHPENSSMADIYVDQCQIQGIAVKVIKNVR